MKDLQDARQDMLDFQRSSPAQDLAHTMSQASQDGNEAIPKSSSYMLCLFGLAFPCSSIATQNLLKFRPTLLVSFVRPRTSWHEQMMSLVEMARSAVPGPKQKWSVYDQRIDTAILYVKICFRKSCRIDFTILKISWCGSYHPINPEALHYKGSD